MTPFTFHDAKPYWQEVVKSAPLIHCITNLVAVNFTANVLLAAGASPAMVVASEEIDAFTLVAANLSINIGTLDKTQMACIRQAVAAAAKHGKPWVFDPVAVSDTLEFRSHFARELLKYHPAVIRGNAGEILWLAGEQGKSRGADSLSASDEAIESAELLAQQQGCIVAVTGKRDYITDGQSLCYVEGGSILQTRVTACGCALSALIAAFALQKETLYATAAACAVMKQAGTYAARHSRGMGSFATALLDGLSHEVRHENT